MSNKHNLTPEQIYSALRDGYSTMSDDFFLGVRTGIRTIGDPDLYLAPAWIKTALAVEAEKEWECEI